MAGHRPDLYSGIHEGMHRIAHEFVKNRRLPSHPELMKSDNDDILNFLSGAYPSSVHGYSTTLMLSMFRIEYILERLPAAEIYRILLYVHRGSPAYHSANDGLVRP
jgi:hypothetical protein